MLIECATKILYPWNIGQFFCTGYEKHFPKNTFPCLTSNGVTVIRRQKKRQKSNLPVSLRNTCCFPEIKISADLPPSNILIFCVFPSSRTLLRTMCEVDGAKEWPAHDFQA